ncbi:MAG: ChaN family lipoprotein [Deltaproteobacteria bacterium]|nr:ChaN family lipoprotein [Deltaproteobacteria bacterium]
MNQRIKLLKIQKKILEGLKEEALTHLKTIPLSLKSYYHEYKNEFKQIQAISGKKELLKNILKSHIIYSGDYHTFDQSQRIVLRILREIIQKKKNIILGVEFFLSSHQQYINDYLNNKITEKELLQKTDYKKNWGFDWNNFKPLFDFAKLHSLKIIALNSTPIHGTLEADDRTVLERRDEFASKIIINLTQKYPEHLIYVIFGDLHLASKHLPKRVEEKLKTLKLNRKRLIIYQNSETIYWKLAKRGLEHDVDVVRLKDDAYCIINATPWVKLQSYLHWQEKADALRPQMSSFWAHFDTEKDIIDYNDQIFKYIKIVSQFLDFDLKDKDDFSVYTLEDLDFLNSLSGLSKKEKKWIEKTLQRGRSLFIPRENIIYLSDLSINDAVEQVTQYIYFQKSHSKEFVFSGEHNFYAHIFLHALGFLGSKIVNPKRKSDKIIDLKEFIQNCEGKTQNLKEEQKLELYKAAVEFVHSGEEFLKTGQHTTIATKILKTDFLIGEVARILGYRIGDRLYRGLVKGELKLLDIQCLFDIELESKKKIELTYLNLLKKLSHIHLAYQSRKEHL